MNYSISLESFLSEIESVSDVNRKASIVPQTFDLLNSCFADFLKLIISNGLRINLFNISGAEWGPFWTRIVKPIQYR